MTKKYNSNEKIKLHIGCGTNYFEGWINIDNNSDNNIKKLDLNWDLRNPLPFKANCVDFIYNEHFLEHLTVQDGLKALRDFKRVLKPNGILRIAMPDLTDIIKTYNNKNWKIDNAESFRKFGLDFMQTRAEYLNINFRWWGHQWLYDWEELERRLIEAGFNNITQCKLKKSSYTEFQNLETRNESSLIAEASSVKNISEPILTVVIVTYNHGKYIKRTLDSVLSQKTNFLFKIILADDCSTDGTKEICQEYADKYPEIINFIPRMNNVGITENGYEAACKVDTIYYTSLDGDDYWTDENKLQIQIDLLEENPDCVICGHNTIYHYPDRNLELVGHITPNVPEKFSLENNKYLHSSSRVYRKIFDFNKYPKELLGDLCFYHAMLGEGNCIYYNKVMSVYNNLNQGSVYAQLSLSQKLIRSNDLGCSMLKYFNFKHEEYYLRNWLYDPGLYQQINQKTNKERALKIYHYITTKALKKQVQEECLVKI